MAVASKTVPARRFTWLIRRSTPPSRSVAYRAIMHQALVPNSSADGRLRRFGGLSDSAPRGLRPTTDSEGPLQLCGVRGTERQWLPLMLSVPSPMPARGHTECSLNTVLYMGLHASRVHAGPMEHWRAEHLRTQAWTGLPVTLSIVPTNV